MRQSENVNEIAAALSAAQSEMGGAVKGANNPFFKSKYADLGEVIKVLKAPLAANGLSFTQFPVSDLEHKSVGVCTRVMHSSGQWLEQDYYIPLTKFDAQAVGSCLSYSKRYALQAVFGIPSADDDGEAAMLRVDQTKVQVKAEARKEQHDEALARNVDTIEQIKVYLSEETDEGLQFAREAFGELSEKDQQALWLAPTKGGCLTTRERKIMKEGLG